MPEHTARLTPLIERVERLLYAADPIGLDAEINADEYRIEARTIVPRLDTAANVEDAQRIVHEEFTHWFGEDVAGDADRYADIARDVWWLWQHWEDLEPVRVDPDRVTPGSMTPCPVCQVEAFVDASGWLWDSGPVPHEHLPGETPQSRG